ncbi:hypothetical protein GQ44DRAFT_700690 [Phaeosphaeriaceae sp. PMI808]|nr:hypothetical protein GQ44DRAFT_700690 [Phaeosphaeriaceae sp. PMI808]
MQYFFCKYNALKLYSHNTNRSSSRGCNIRGDGYKYVHADEKRNIAAMLNQDMTGYTAGYTSRNMTPKSGAVTDSTNTSLTNFTRCIIAAYTNTEAADTECGYSCSDHASARRVGYSSAL